MSQTLSFPPPAKPLPVTESPQRAMLPLALAIPVLFWMLSAAAGFLEMRLGRPSSSESPPNGFSAIRAVRDVRAIAVKPHPVGSLEHDRVRDYILDRAAALGLAPRIQAGPALDQVYPGEYSWAGVSNVVGRIAGTGSGPALALVAHYDSVAGSPGATDDGHGIAVLLETARALTSGAPRPVHDILFVFTDAEEIGLLGAKEFAEDSPAARNLGLVINLDARGTSGPSILFETSPGNGSLVGAFARSVPRPFGSSAFQPLYRFLPHGTDAAVFDSRKTPFLNLALTGDPRFYHTPNDNVAHLALESLQHQGETVLALAAHFAAVDLPVAAAPNAVFFPLAGSLLRYPRTWALPLAVVAAVFCVILLIWGARQRQVRLARAALVLPCVAVLAALAGVAASLAWRAAVLARPGVFHSRLETPPDQGWFLVSFVCLGFTVICVALRLLSSKLSQREWLAGALACWTAAALLFALLAPEASYLFLLPACFGCAALAAALLAEIKNRPALRILAAALAGVPLFAWIPPLYLFSLAAGMMAVVPLAAGSAFFASLLLPSLQLSKRMLGRVAAVAGALCVGTGVTACLSARFSTGAPAQSTVFYASEAAGGKAMWGNTQTGQNVWSQQYLGAHPAQGQLPSLFPFPILFNYAPAPHAPGLEEPQIQVESVPGPAGKRTVRVFVHSRRVASALMLFAADTPGLSLAGIAGKCAACDGRRASPFRLLIAHGVPADGLKVEFTVEGAQRPVLHLVERSEGLPGIPGKAYQPRPAWIVRSLAMDMFNESTLITSSIQL